MNFIWTSIIVIVTAVAAGYDIKERRVPNRLVLPAICLALLYNLCNFNIDNLIIALFTFALLLIMYFTNDKFIGGGDVKLIAFVTLMLGMGIKIVIFYACLFTIPMLVYFYIKELYTKQKQYVPLAVPIFLGTLVKVFLGVM